jgi:hypothetical protein
MARIWPVSVFTGALWFNRPASRLIVMIRRISSWLWPRLMRRETDVGLTPNSRASWLMVTVGWAAI